jgi:hypothetical protein
VLRDGVVVAGVGVFVIVGFCGGQSVPLGERKRPRQLVSYRGACIWRFPTLPRLKSAVPSAVRGLTAVFGMGTGGTLALLSPKVGDSISSGCSQSSALCVRVFY